MQLKTLLPSLLLLALRPEAVFAAPEDAKPLEGTYINASPLGVTKRDPFALMMQPHYMAMPLNNNAGSLAKRQSCPAGSSSCYDGCCPTATVCGIYGGEVGCCPRGKTCSGVGGCSDSSQVLCDGYCCPEGSKCAKDASGNDGCATGGNQDDDSGNDDSNNGCRAGYSPCDIFQGCCPTGSECILPQNCNIPCTPDDPPCGNGCCEKGTVCTKDFTCSRDSSGDFTDLTPTTTVTRTSRFIRFTTTTEEVIIETTTEEVIETTTEDDTESSTTEESSTETTETTSLDFFGNDATTTTSTTRTVARVTITTVTGNNAPTMAAMIGNGLGVAAGLLGALVL